MKPSRELRLLLVEDSAADATLFKVVLARLGYHCELQWVKDGEEALDVLHRRGAKSDSPTPDAVVLDLGLPKLSGREVLENIRKHPELAPIPVVVLSTSAMAEDIFHCQQLGVRRYITKPTGLAAFEEMMERLIGVDFADIAPAAS